MSDQDKHTTQYSSGDIEKYLRGELSAPEMHALERAALDDPFLADALDGMDLHRQLPEQPSFREDMADLGGRLQERVAEKKKQRVLPLFMRYAAAVVLLLGIGFTIYYILPGRHTDIAEMRSRKPAPSTSPAIKQDTGFTDSFIREAPAAGTTDTDKQTETETRSLASARKQKQLKVSANEVASSGRGVQVETEKKEKALTLSEGKPVRPDQSDSIVFDVKRLRVDSLPVSSYAYQPGEPKPNAVMYKRAPSEALVFSGKVIDQNNHPLPGAYLALKNNLGVNATTDKNGYFNLRLNNKLDTTSAVVVNSVGYEQVSMLLNTENRKGNVIQLQPQHASLNEVVVTGYGSKRREYMRQNIDAKQKDLSLMAIPAEGWPIYTAYLELRKRSVALDSTLRGVEAISFIVDKNGGLSSFKVEQSISPAHDSATISMIKEGPAWILLSGKKERARVILIY